LTLIPAICIVNRASKETLKKDSKVNERKPNPAFLNMIGRDAVNRANKINNFKKPITGEEVFNRTLKPLLSRSGNTKTDKEVKSYVMAQLTLAPSELSGFNVCPFATNECKAMCLKTSGRMIFEEVTRAQVVKTLGFFLFRKHFKDQINKDLTNLDIYAERKGLTAAVRMNVLSDINWMDTANKYPNIQFYDYTKNTTAMSGYIQGHNPKNYYFTASWSEEMTLKSAKDIVNRGMNVAVPFLVNKGDKLPPIWWGMQVIDGDLTDARFLDPKGVIVGLKAKGKAKKAAKDGFVIVNHHGRN
jgi:hypothetical protein